ncbi:MAG TPA: glycosyltransferase family 39 protein [Opitutaceae bacterium]|nr:glycosyltransferase family 39 protein [Opitutaceae bacterium]
MTPPSPTPPASWRRDLLWLAVGFGLLYFLFLGRAPLDYKDEGRYAEIPREMVAAHDWVTPRLDGIDYFEKPPLMYWAVAACLKVFGPGETSMRAMPALFSVAGILLAYAAGRRLHGRPAGLASAGVLGTSFLYFGIGHVLILDMAVSVLMSATLFCFLLGVREPPGPGWWHRRRALFYGLYASAALATLAKGLMGFLLSGAVMFAWLLVFRQWRRLRPFYLPTGLLLFLAIAAPWHLLAAARNPGWAWWYFVHEHWLRFTTNVAGRVQPWWFFLPIVLAGLFPWIGFLWPALRDGLGRWSRRKENADAWYLATWALVILLFFSKSQSKLVPYILPVFPPLAVLIGAWLAAPGRERSDLRRGLGIFSFGCGLLAAGVLLAVLRPGLIIKDPAQLAAVRPFAWPLAAAFVAGGILAPLLAGFGRKALLGGMGVAMALVFAIIGLARPALTKPGTRALALIVAARAQPGDEIVHYHEFFHDFLFYSGRLVDVVAFTGELEFQVDPAPAARARELTEAAFRQRWQGPGRIFAVVRKSDSKPFFADPAHPSYLLGQTRDHYLYSNRP